MFLAWSLIEVVQRIPFYAEFWLPDSNWFDKIKISCQKQGLLSLDIWCAYKHLHIDLNQASWSIWAWCHLILNRLIKFPLHLKRRYLVCSNMGPILTSSGNIFSLFLQSILFCSQVSDLRPVAPLLFDLTQTWVALTSPLHHSSFLDYWLDNWKKVNPKMLL